MTVRTGNKQIPTLLAGSGVTLTEDASAGTITISAAGATTEAIQDAIAAALSDTGDIDFTYDDAGNAITADVKADAVTYAKMQNVSATDRLLGRDTAGAGNVEELTLGAGLAFTGAGGIECSITQYTDEMAQDAVGAMLDDSGDIDFTYTDGTPALSAVVKNDAVTYAKIQDVSATNKILGRVSGGAGNVEEAGLSDFILTSYTVGTLPSAAVAGKLIYVSDGTANKRLAVSDGANWRFPDGNVVS